LSGKCPYFLSIGVFRFHPLVLKKGILSYLFVSVTVQYPGNTRARIIGAGIADCIGNLNGFSGCYCHHIARVRRERDVDILLDNLARWIEVTKRNNPWTGTPRQRSIIRPVLSAIVTSLQFVRLRGQLFSDQTYRLTRLKYFEYSRPNSFCRCFSSARTIPRSTAMTNIPVIHTAAYSICFRIPCSTRNV